MKQNENLLKGNWSYYLQPISIILLMWMLISLPVALFAQDNAPKKTKISVDYKHTIDFSKYKTYKFEIAKVMTDQGLLEVSEDMPVKKEVENAISNQLEIEGLSMREQNPDVLIIYIRGIQDKMQAYQVAPNIPYRHWAPLEWYKDKWSNFWTDDLKQSILAIDIVDTKSRTLVWWAYCITDVQKTDLDSTITLAVSKAFSNYPPQNEKLDKSTTAVKD